MLTLNTILNYFRPAKSVDSIMSGFTKIVADLEAYEDEKRTEAASADERMVAARKERDAATIDATAAKHQASLIRSIIA